MNVRLCSRFKRYMKACCHFLLDHMDIMLICAVGSNLKSDKAKSCKLSLNSVALRRWQAAASRKKGEHNFTHTLPLAYDQAFLKGAVHKTDP